MRPPRLLPFVLLTLCACARPASTYVKPDMSTFDRDHYECRRDATFVSDGAPLLHRSLYRDCMRARGYTEIRKVGASPPAPEAARPA